MALTWGLPIISYNYGRFAKFAKYAILLLSPRKKIVKKIPRNYTSMAYLAYLANQKLSLIHI